MAEGRVKIRIEGDSSKLESTLSGVEASFGKMGSVLAGVGMAVGNALTEGVGKAVTVLAGSIDKASDFNETISKAGVIFGQELVPGLEKWAETGAASFGQSKQQALDAAATFAVFGKSAGLAGQDLEKFSTTQVQLASDLASFHNTSPQEAIEAIGAAMRGEAEPMRKYGVLLDDATMRNKALELGLISSTKEALTPQNKVLAANALILEKTADAQGDFARTSDGLANSQRSLSAQWENMQIAIGEKLLPMKIKLVDFILNRMMPALTRIGDALAPFFTEIVGGFRAFIAAFKAGDGDITSSGFPGFMEKVANVTRVAFDWIRDNVPPVLERLRAGFAQVVDFIQAYVLPIWPLWLEGFQFVVNAYYEKLAPLWPAIVEAVASFVEAVKAIIDKIVLIFETLVKAALFIWDQFGGQLVSILSAYWDTVWGVLGGAIQILTGIFNLIKSVLTGNWSDAWDAIKQILSGAWSVIWSVVEGAWKILLGILSIAWDTIKGAAGTAWDLVVDLIKDHFNRLKEGAQEVVDKIVEFFGGLGSGLSSAMMGLADFITSPFRDAFNEIASLWNRTVGSISFQVPGWVPGMGGNGWDVPNIPTFANGGLAYGPMLAIVGDHNKGGRAGNAEIITPEDKMRQVIREEGGGGGITIGTINLGRGGPDELVRELDWMQRTMR